MAHILVVDDDDIVAEIAAEILISAGHACSWVSDADEAWRMLEWRRPDVLLLDEAMPDESGSSFLRRLRGSAKFHDLPVILFTAQGGTEDERRAMINGAQDFMSKPVQPQLLVGKVARVLDACANRPQHDQMSEWAEFQLHHRTDHASRRTFL